MNYRLCNEMPVQEVWQGDVCNEWQAGHGKEIRKATVVLMGKMMQKVPTLPVRMALMRFWVSHMLEPDWPLLDRQVWLMMLAHACTVKGMRYQEGGSGWKMQGAGTYCWAGNFGRHYSWPAHTKSSLRADIGSQELQRGMPQAVLGHASDSRPEQATSQEGAESAWDAESAWCRC